MSRLIFRLIAALVAIPVGRAVTKTTQAVWLRTHPDDPIKDPTKVEARWRDALVWATLTGLGSAVAQLLTTKGADTVWRAITGTPSPGSKANAAVEPEAEEPSAKELKAARAS
jgi:hypothetical protein